MEAIDSGLTTKCQHPLIMITITFLLPLEDLGQLQGVDDGTKALACLPGTKELDCFPGVVAGDLVCVLLAAPVAEGQCSIELNGVIQSWNP